MAETPLAQKIINVIEKLEGAALAIKDLKDHMVQIKDSLEYPAGKGTAKEEKDEPTS